jgi:hypothetical protein
MQIPSSSSKCDAAEVIASTAALNVRLPSIRSFGRATGADSVCMKFSEPMYTRFARLPLALSTLIV